MLAGTDFFTVEVLTWRGLVTYYVLFFIHLDSRRISIDGITDHPDASWMSQVARNATLEELGYLNGCRYVLHDRDTKFCAEFRETLAAGGVKCLRLPPRSPNLNAFGERWVRSVKEECLSKLILFGEASLRRALTQFQEHYHTERNHQGKGNVLLFPRADELPKSSESSIECRERLGGLLLNVITGRPRRVSADHSDSPDLKHFLPDSNRAAVWGPLLIAEPLIATRIGHCISHTSARGTRLRGRATMRGRRPHTPGKPRSPTARIPAVWRQRWLWPFLSKSETVASPPETSSDVSQTPIGVGQPVMDVGPDFRLEAVRLLNCTTASDTLSVRMYALPNPRYAPRHPGPREMASLKNPHASAGRSCARAMSPR